MEDVRQRIDFIKAIDALKEVNRKTYLLSESRFENSAEHSWQVSTLALVLADYAPEGVDLFKVIKMLLIHDVVEVDAGDVLLYDKERNEEHAKKELAAAVRLFGILPDALGDYLLELWREFEAEETVEAQLAAGLDRIIPLVHNIHTNGRAWRELGVRYEQIIEKNEKIATASSELWEYLKGEIDDLFGKNSTLE